MANISLNILSKCCGTRTAGFHFCLAYFETRQFVPLFFYFTGNNLTLDNVVALLTFLTVFGFRGWGLRTLDDVPLGTFVCTYAGQILNEDMANKVSNCTCYQSYTKKTAILQTCHTRFLRETLQHFGLIK